MTGALLRSRGPWLTLLAVAVLVAAPFLVSDFRVGLLTIVVAWALFAASLDLLIGYTGLPSLGHALFFGAGGYTAAIVADRLVADALVTLLAATVVSALVAVVAGALAVRTRGTYFLMLTLALAQIGYTVALTWTDVTGGSNGKPTPTFTFPGFELSPSTNRIGFYFYTLGAAAVGYALLRVVVASPFGRALVGIRENEARMRAIGYRPVGYKLAAFTLSGAVAGYAGALLVQFERFASTSLVSFGTAALVLVMVIVGGRGTLYGPVLGAAAVLLLREELQTRVDSAGVELFRIGDTIIEVPGWELYLGVIFVLIVYFLPQGVGGLARQLRGGRGGRPGAPDRPPPTTADRHVEVDQPAPQPARAGAPTPEPTALRATGTSA